MALANVAFLAATNGYRVLVMDWDLEAPGLHYHFRGLVDAPEARALKEAPGILNLVWDWTNSIKRATAAELENIFSRFDNDGIFENYVKTIHEDTKGRLDFINAGSPKIDVPHQIDYADALAHFSWPSFFAEYAGGSVLQNLRSWAKRNYDFVLIDSRTGLADVSGICTTQLPDAVALCFILNRQNIDGIARVAAAIRLRRHDEIELHAIPMRVSAKGTSEEDDARARGIHELSKIGGFSPDIAADDFKLLSVRAADNVPYYETLAPVTATDAATDPLTLNYLRLANRILDKTIGLPDLSPVWIETINRRLQPRHATIDYVGKLMASDPIRAISEVETLLESAFDTVMDGGDLSDEYVTALVEASLFLSGRGEGPFDAASMLDRALDLLRALAAANPDKWRTFLSTAIERHIETGSFFLETEEELALLEELDALLADSNTAATRLRRLSSRKRAARLYLLQDELDAATQTAGECMRLIKEFQSTSMRLAPDQQDQLASSELETILIRGEIAERQEKWTKAASEFNLGLERLRSEQLSARGELARLAFEFHSHLARMPVGIRPITRAKHSVEAVRLGSQQSVGSMVGQFSELAQAIINVPDEIDLALSFCDYALDMQDRRGSLQNTNYWARVPRSAMQFFTTAAQLAEIVGRADEHRSKSALSRLGDTAIQVWQTLSRRRHTFSSRAKESLSEPLIGLADALKKAGAPSEMVAALREAAHQRPKPPSAA